MSPLAALQSVALRAVPTANRFAALSISSGVILALVSTLTPLLGKVPRMSLRHMFHAVIAVLLLASPAFAQPELGTMFVEGGLTSDQAAARAATRSPDVERKAAELDSANASVAAARLQRLPQVSTRLSYTRLSALDAPELAPGLTFPVLLNSYVAQAQIVVPLSDYVVELVDAETTLTRARIAALDARVDLRIAVAELHHALGTDTK